jgi:polyisoprenoid-binding protein YceI
MKSGVYEIDSSRSRIQFEVINLLVIRVIGQFKTYKGLVKIAPRFENSSAEVSIDLNSIDTDWKGRDDHLKNEDFFDVRKFPKMTYISSHISGTPEHFQLKGVLDLHGYKKEVELRAWELPDGSIEARGELNRRDFGLTAGPSIKNRVELKLLVVLRKIES